VDALQFLEGGEDVDGGGGVVRPVVTKSDGGSGPGNVDWHGLLTGYTVIPGPRKATAADFSVAALDLIDCNWHR